MVTADEARRIEPGKLHGDPVLPRLRLDHRRAFAQHVAEGHHFLCERQLARLDHRQIENLVDELQQVPARLQYLLDVGLLAGCGLGRACFQELRESEYGVERRAQFVTHVRQEFRLRQVRLVGNSPRLAQCQFNLFALRDVAKQHGDFSTPRAADAKSVSVEPALIEVRVQVRRTCRLARQGDPAEGVDPMCCVKWCEFAHASTGLCGQPELLAETWVGLDKAVVDGHVGRVEQHIDDAVALVDGIKQIAIACAALAKCQLNALQLAEIAQHNACLERPARIRRDGRCKLRPDLCAVRSAHPQDT